MPLKLCCEGHLQPVPHWGLYLAPWCRGRNTLHWPTPAVPIQTAFRGQNVFRKPRRGFAMKLKQRIACQPPQPLMSWAFDTAAIFFLFTLGTRGLELRSVLCLGLARLLANKCLLRAHVEPAGQIKDENLHSVVTHNIFPSQNLENTICWRLFRKVGSKKCTPL